MLRVCCLILCLVAGSRQLSIKEFTVPTAVQVGEDAELQCQYSLEENESESALFVKWWWTPLHPTDDQKKQLYQRIAGHDPQILHSNITIKENDTILLLNLKPEDSGTYECEVSDIDELRMHQELIVYSKGTGPQMNITTVADGPDEDEDEDVLVSCNADEVAPLPDLSITVNGEVVSIAELVNDSTKGLYSISANATLSKEKAEDAEIRCELFFKNENISHPAYIDTKIYQSLGAELSTTETPEDTTGSESTPNSLQNMRDGSSHIGNSWIFVLAVVVHLLLLL